MQLDEKLAGTRERTLDLDYYLAAYSIRKLAIKTLKRKWYQNMVSNENSPSTKWGHGAIQRYVRRLGGVL